MKYAQVTTPRLSFMPCAPCSSGQSCPSTTKTSHKFTPSGAYVTHIISHHV